MKAKQRTDTNNTYQTIGLLETFYMMNSINSSILFSNSSEKVLLTNVYVCGLVIYVQPRVMSVPCEWPTQSIYYEKFTSQPILSKYLLSPKSHYYTRDVNTQGRQMSHNPLHRHISCNQRNRVQISIMFLHCIERRCHLYNPQDGGGKTLKLIWAYDFSGNYMHEGRYKNSKLSVISMLYSISFSSNMYFRVT